MCLVLKKVVLGNTFAPKIMHIWPMSQIFARFLSVSGRVLRLLSSATMDIPMKNANATCSQ